MHHTFRIRTNAWADGLNGRILWSEREARNLDRASPEKAHRLCSPVVPHKAPDGDGVLLLEATV